MEYLTRADQPRAWLLNYFQFNQLLPSFRCSVKLPQRSSSSIQTRLTHAYLKPLRKHRKISIILALGAMSAAGSTILQGSERCRIFQSACIPRLYPHRRPEINDNFPFLPRLPPFRIRRKKGSSVHCVNINTTMYYYR